MGQNQSDLKNRGFVEQLFFLFDLVEERRTPQKIKETLAMALETPVTTIDTLVASNPASTDGLQDADNHIRNVEKRTADDFPKHHWRNDFGHTELNVLDGITSSTAELNLLDGVTATTADQLP